jgi:hypothetical protein
MVKGKSKVMYVGKDVRLLYKDCEPSSMQANLLWFASHLTIDDCVLIPELWCFFLLPNVRHLSECCRALRELIS